MCESFSEHLGSRQQRCFKIEWGRRFLDIAFRNQQMAIIQWSCFFVHVWLFFDCLRWVSLRLTFRLILPSQLFIDYIIIFFLLSLFIVLPLKVETWCLSDIIKVSNDWLRNCDKISLANILRKKCLFTPHVNVSRSSHVSSCQHNKIQHVAHYPQYYLGLRKIRIISYNST